MDHLPLDNNDYTFFLMTGAVYSASKDKKPVPSQGGGDVVTHQMNSPLMLVESFLQALTNADKDGRIVITRKGTATPPLVIFLPNWVNMV